MRRYIERGIERIKERGKGVPKIVEDKITPEHLEEEKEYISQGGIGEATHPKSYPKTHKEIVRICKELCEKRNIGKERDIVLIIDVGCSKGHNTISLAKKLLEVKEKKIKFHIYGIEQISDRVERAKWEYPFSKILYNTSFHHLGMTDEGVRTKEGGLLKVDIIKVTDVSPGIFFADLKKWAENNLKEGGYIFHAFGGIGVDIDVEVFQRKKNEKTGEYELVLIEKFKDISYSGIPYEKEW